MLVFVDANTLISGFALHGFEHQFLKKRVRKGIELVTSEDVLEETADVINRKFPKKAHLLKEFLQLIEIKVIRRKRYAGLLDRQKVRDEEDKHVLAAAKAARCEIIVTGDKDLLVLKEAGGIEIKTTREIMENL